MNPLAATLEQAVLSKSRLYGRGAKTVFGGCSSAWYADAKLRGPGHNLAGRVFVKRVLTRQVALNEVAAYHVARISGLADVAPATVIDDQKWAAKRAHDFEPRSRETALVVQMRWEGYKEVGCRWTPSDAFERRLRLFDHLINNIDRHTENMMVRDGHEVAIDHGLAFYFHSGDDRNPMPVHPDDAACVARLLAGGWELASLLEGLVGVDVLHGFARRLGRTASAAGVL